MKAYYRLVALLVQKLRRYITSDHQTIDGDLDIFLMRFLSLAIKDFRELTTQA
jgi:hypothetical protein